MIQAYLKRETECIGVGRDALETEASFRTDQPIPWLLG
jgi:hypothetical protein